MELKGRRLDVCNLVWRNMMMMRLAMATRFVDEVSPVSAMLLGPQGSGKTEILEALAGSECFRLQSDLTQMGLAQAFLDARDEDLLGLVVKDFGTMVNKGPAVAMRAVTWLAGAMAEGVGRIDRGGNRWHDFGNVQLGLYTAMTERDFDRNVELLETNAFLSRMVPILHKFSRRDDRVVRDLIREGRLKLRGYLWWPDDMKPEQVKLDGSYDGLIEDFTQLVHRQCPAVYAGQRTYNVFETLLKASARLRGVNQVEDVDADNLNRLRSVWELPPFIPVAKAGRS